MSSSEPHGTIDAAFAAGIAFVGGKRAQGFSDEDISRELLKAGWQASDIERVFTALGTAVPTASSAANPPHAQEIASQKRRNGGFFEWLKRDWPMKLGAFFIILAFGWLVSYGLIHRWLDATHIILMGSLVGVASMAAGWRRMKDFKQQGAVFIVLGFTILGTCVFAAHQSYHLINAYTALVIALLGVGCMTLASVLFQYRPLAVLGLVFAGLVPLFSGLVAFESSVFLFAYLLIVALGTLWVVGVTNHRLLSPIMLGIAFVYSLPYFGAGWEGELLQHIPEMTVFVTFALALSVAAILVATTLRGLLSFSKEETLPDIWTAFLNGLFLLCWVTAILPEHLISAGLLLLGILYAGLGATIWRATRRQDALMVHAGLAIVFFAAVIVRELEGKVLIATLSVLSAMLTLAVQSMTGNVRLALKCSSVFIVPGLLSLSSAASPAWRDGILHADFFVLLIIAAMLMVVGGALWQSAKEREDMSAAKSATILGMIGTLYLYLLWWLSWHALLVNDNFAVMFSLTGYTIIGIGTYFVGRDRNNILLRRHGAALLIFVAFRLLVVEVWEMEILPRIITFFTIGVLLILTAFLARKQDEPRAEEGPQTPPAA